MLFFFYYFILFFNFLHSFAIPNIYLDLLQIEGIYNVHAYRSFGYVKFFTQTYI